ncbi:MAG: dihydroorotase, partial [Maribacter sp.]
GTVDFVTSDHTPLNIELKQVEFDNADYGTIGLESMFGVLNNIFDLEKSIDLLTKGRKTFNIKEPMLKEGDEASLTFFDPTKEYEFSMDDIYSTCKNSLFLGKSLKGRVLGSLANNSLILNS